MTALPYPGSSAARYWQFVQLGCYWLLRTLGWLSLCLACVVSLNVLFFILLGNFSVEGFLFQLDNFGSRYLAADASRRSTFAMTWLVANLALLAIVGLLRRHSLFDRSNSKES